MQKHWDWKQMIKQGFIISCLFTAGLLLTPSAVPAATQLTVSNTYVNVRGGPDTNTAVIASVNKGEKYTALDQRGDWYKIKVGNTEGWVAGWLVQANKVSNTPASVVVVKSNSINVRGGPGTSYAVVGQTNPNAQLPVLARSGDWIKIKLPNGTIGWVANWLVQTQNTSGQQSTSNNQNTLTKAKQATVNATSVNVRSGPGTSYEIVASVNQGQNFTVKEVSGQWLKISLPGGKIGWLANWLTNVSEVTGNNQNGTPDQAKPAAESAKGKQATITAVNVNVRSGPDTSYGIVTSANKGQKYTISEVNGQWLKISLPGGQAGWIANWLASVSEAPLAQPAAPTTSTGSNSAQLVIKNNDVNVRGGPGTQHNVVGQVSRGQRLGVLERTGDWYKVSLAGGVSGWVASWMGDLEKAEASPAPGDPPVATEDTDQSATSDTEVINNLKNIQIRQENNHTMVAIESAGELNYDMFLLGNPQRLVIDLKNTNIGDLPEKSNVNTEAVDQMRIGLMEKIPPVVRVVFDLNQSVVCLDKLSDDRRRLNLDIYVPEVGEFLAGRIIVIDPGHGGKDPGAIGPTGLREKDVNLDISSKLAQLLTANGARVVQTRDGDEFVDLYQRTAIAKQEGAEVFLSIHINANVSSDKNGTSTYYRRDSGSFPTGVDQADNQRLAGLVQSEMLRTLGTRSLGVLQANFVVLSTSPVPAVLAEVAFVSNPAEEQILKQESVRAKVADALFMALNNYFAPTY